MYKIFFVYSLCLLSSIARAFPVDPALGRHQHWPLFQTREAASLEQITSVNEVRALTEQALAKRGTKDGIEAIEELGRLSSLRLPFEFPENSDAVAPLPSFLPEEVTQKVFEIMKRVEEKGLLSTNPDSVDGLPSFHLNLVSDGRPVAEGDKDGFQRALKELREIILPYVESKLLKKAQEMIGSSQLRIGDVFLRRYGEDILNLESRKGISAHYDVFSRITSVIAMDDTACEGRNGLFTTFIDSDGKTSNHSSMRRFFPLRKGDAVLHTWEVLHGVDVEAGIDRTSLIVWFVEETKPESVSFPSPWLLDADASKDVRNFVLGSASESVNSDPNAVFDFYLKSAMEGNTFALTRLGSLCEEMDLTDDQRKTIEQLLAHTPNYVFPSTVLQNCSDDELIPLKLWYEGSIRGNPLAQRALADEVMFIASETKDRDCRLFAATLFGLAAQQGDEIGQDALQRVVQYEVSVEGIEDEESFRGSPVVQIAERACKYL